MPNADGELKSTKSSQKLIKKKSAINASHAKKKNHSLQKNKEKFLDIAPNFLVISIILGSLFLLAIMAQDLLRYESPHESSATLAAQLLLGMTICFFWRRLPRAGLKSFINQLFTATLWIYLIMLAGAYGTEALLHFSFNLITTINATALIVQSVVGGLFALHFVSSLPKRSKRVAMIAASISLALAAITLFSAFSTGRLERAEKGSITLSAEPLADFSLDNVQQKHTDILNPHTEQGLAEMALEPSAQAPKSEHELETLSHPSPHAPDSIADSNPGSEEDTKAESEDADDAEEASENAPPGSLITKEHDSNPKRTTDASDQSRLTLWGYEPQNGPLKWGELHPTFEVCASGTMQSPVDLSRTTPKGRNLNLAYTSSEPSLLLGYQAPQLMFSPSDKAYFSGKEFQLLHIEFHRPSEHTINGVRYAAEIQFIHKSNQDQMLVLAVMVEYGTPIQALEPILKNIPPRLGELATVAGHRFNPKTLLPGYRRYFSYDGSLTTPPCSENATWLVFNQPLTMSKRQLDQLMFHHPNNIRPIQRNLGLQ